MISLFEIARGLLCEELTFRQLLDYSDAARKGRANNIDVRSLSVTPTKDGESWNFSYKSKPSTTGKRWRGYIKFLQNDLDSNKSAYAINCVVDCECPDFKHRFAEKDTKYKASVVGPNSLNKNSGVKSHDYNIEQQVGLCKHLIALSGYLKTKMEKKKQLREGIVIDKLKNEIGTLEKEFDKLDDIGQSTANISKELEKKRKELDKWEKLYPKI